MGYYKLENDKWRVNVSMKGQRLTQVVDTEDEAKETEKDFKQQLLDGKPVNKIRANKQITLSLAFENTINNPENKWSKNGVETPHGRKQRYNNNSFLKFFGQNRILKTITKDDWYKYINQFGETNTNNRRASTMNKILKQAFADQYITKEHFFTVPRQKEKVGRVDTFSREEEIAIIQTCEKLGYLDLKDFVIALIDIGARPEELRTSTPKDLIRTPEGEITLALYRPKTCNDSIVGLRKRSQDILVKRSNQKRFFMSSYRQLYNRWNDVRDRLGKNTDEKWVFYTCRHTCASRMAQAGFTLVQIANHLGHAHNSPTTRKYIHFFPKDAINIGKRMDEYEEELSAKSVRQLHEAK